MYYDKCLQPQACSPTFYKDFELAPIERHRLDVPVLDIAEEIALAFVVHGQTNHVLHTIPVCDWMPGIGWRRFFRDQRGLDTSYLGVRQETLVIWKQ